MRVAGRAPADDKHLTWKGDGEMFTNHCEACEKRQLIFPSQVKAVLDTAAGVELLYTCWCGSEQTYLMVPAAQRTGVRDGLVAA